jgi:DNA-binding transcriptional MerR regulator
MSYTVKQLSKLAGVSVRTLHYYDEIGLLVPSRVRANGYRQYDPPAVLRLQQILFYKELGLSLDEIRDVLDQPDFDVVRALQAHRAALHQRLGRLSQLLRTVDRTLTHLEGKTPMDPKELFEGFSDEQQAEYEQQAEALWGETVRESSRRWRGYSPEKKNQILAEASEIYQALIAHLGQPPASPAVQALVARWHQNLRHFYEPTPDVLRGLSQAYVDDPQFNATFRKLHPDLAPFVREAVAVYCDRLK